MIQVENVVKSYDDKEILHGLRFNIEKGKVHAFLGRNGAGKTTFIRGFMNIFKFNSGKITIDGRDFNPRDYNIGYLPEERGMYQNVPIIDQLLYFSKLKGIESSQAEESIMSLLEKLDLGTKAKDKLKTLSKGNQQKVQLIQSLMNNPDIIILDEPFSGLDPVNSKILQDLIFEVMGEDTYMIFCSHQMSYVEDICENITMIDHGSIVLDGNINDIKRDKGRGKLSLKANDPTYMYIKDQGYKTMEDEDGVVVDLEGRDRKDFIKDLMDKGYDFERVGLYLPSLNHIYIETVGD